VVISCFSLLASLLTFLLAVLAWAQYYRTNYGGTMKSSLSYVHLPAGERVDSLTSMTWGTFTRGLTRGQMTHGEKDETGNKDDKIPINGTLVKLSRVPKIEKVLAESEIEPLAHLASDTVRTFEIVYSS